MNRLRAYLLAFLCGAVLRRALAYAVVVYGFEVLPGGNWPGVLYVALVAPYLVASPWAGLLLDRRPKRQVLLGATFAATLVVTLLWLGEWRGAWMGGGSRGAALVALILAYGISYAISYPGFVATVPDLCGLGRVGRATVLLNVLAIVSLAYAPLGVGVLRAGLPWSGVFGGCAILAGLCAAGVALAVPPAPGGRAAVKLRSPDAARPAIPRSLGALLGVAAAFSTLVVGPLEVLLPQFAEGPLGLAPLRAGTFIAVGGTGLVLGSILALRFTRRGAAGRWLCGTGAGGALLVVAMTRAPCAAAGALLFASGVLGGMFSSLSIVATQSRAPDAVRGRIMGWFALIFGGLPGLGGLAANAWAAHRGVVAAIDLSFALAAAVFAMMYAALPALRDRSPAEAPK